MTYYRMLRLIEHLIWKHRRLIDHERSEWWCDTMLFRRHIYYDRFCKQSGITPVELTIGPPLRTIGCEHMRVTGRGVRPIGPSWCGCEPRIIPQNGVA